MPQFEHQRHKPPRTLLRERDLAIVCAPMKSNVNLSRIARTAGCCGIRRMICCGTARLREKIARDTADQLEIEIHRTLPPVLRNLKDEGYHLVGLEQATGSQNIHTFQFTRKTALVVGNERTGLTEQELQMLEHVVEIPVYGMPFSYNAATSASMALYEYCRQFPEG